VWAPKIIAKIGALPDTIASRSIIISMRRRTKDEPIERWRDEKAGTLKALAQQAARWGKDHADTLKRAEPDEPAGLNDRTADNWRPLFAIADLAGGVWPARARAAAAALSGGESTEDDWVGGKLLRDIRDLFDRRREEAEARGLRRKNVDRLSSIQLAGELGGLAERPWSEYRRGKPITQAQLARLLKPYGIASKTIRVATGDGEWVGRGYDREQFEEAFARYLAEPPSCSTPAEGPVADDVALRNARKCPPALACSTVALRTGGLWTAGDRSGGFGSRRCRIESAKQWSAKQSGLRGTHTHVSSLPLSTCYNATSQYSCGKNAKIDPLQSRYKGATRYATKFGGRSAPQPPS
jgi:Protein of unknown function (DUF3631)